MLRLFILITLAFLTSCTPPCVDYCVEGADEFVIDSYQIRQGKLSILEMEGHCIGELPFDAMLEYEDVVAEDDILNIAVYHPSRRDLMDSINFINQTIGFKVTNKCVDIPDIPPVYVAGLTLTEAREAIQESYREHIHDIEVFITYKDRLARKVDLAGLVSVPYIPVDGKIRLYEILSKARVPTNANYFMSYVERGGELLPLDMHRLMVEGDMSQNIVMRGGDKVYIADPTEARAMVMGEVGRPSPVSLPAGYMSLREALVLAGGIPFTGNKNCIQVIRGGLVNPKIYVLSWQHIVHLPNESLLLIPGDTVYVSEKPITRWNRFISQLFPSMNGVTTCNDAYQVFIP
ncbi:MAG: hypothetical protein K940chlam3_00652 [Chlamydiae bacterium]|nr:hypothetical protein [Chlamydiota bacterium]